jgi:hypothetical protein
VVISLELIEHLPEPVAFLRDTRRLLHDGGSMLITTPNRDASPARELWDTDLPPVHLTWFGRRSILELGSQAGCEVAFLDGPGDPILPSANPRCGAWPPLLTAAGAPSRVVRQVRGLSWRMRHRASRALASAGRSPYRTLPALTPEAGTPRTLGVVFRPRVSVTHEPSRATAG